MQSPLNKHDSHNRAAWLTIGSFDGVHMGHQHIIRSLVEKSRQNQCPAVVVTFFPHPQKVLGKIEEPFYLNTPEEKDELMQQLGVDSVLTIHFDLIFSKTTAADFMHMLHHQMAFSHLMIGYNFTLGANREGNSSVLKSIGRKLGYRVEAIKPVQIDAQTVSSSYIRDLLNSGNITSANRFLGRPYQLSGTVIHGDGRGKHIGIPTANLAVWKEKLVPASGVYATIAEMDRHSHAAVVNIGHRPTFYENSTEKSIEVHLLDFSQVIYGDVMRLNLVERIRSEKKFASVQELINQIHEDINQTKEILTHAPV